jgi:hypothetical protein
MMKPISTIKKIINKPLGAVVISFDLIQIAYYFLIKYFTIPSFLVNSQAANEVGTEPIWFIRSIKFLMAKG